MSRRADAKPFPTTPVERELRALLDAPSGVEEVRQGAFPNLAATPLVREIAEELSCTTAEAIVVALRRTCRTSAATFPDEPKLGEAVATHLGLDEASRTFNSAGREDLAAAALGLSVSAYSKNRWSPKGDFRPSRLTRFLLAIEQGLTGGRTTDVSGTNGASSRVRWAQFLDALWDKLDRVRRSRNARQQYLPNLLAEASQLALDSELDEAKALFEFVAYETNRGFETYRLHVGVQFLDSGIAFYAAEGLADGSRARLLLRQVAELLNLFFTGDGVPGGRMGYLDDVVELSRQVLALQASGFAHERAKVTLAEALKEKAMMSPDRREQLELMGQVKSLCEPMSHPSLLPETGRERRIVASAKRHLAVAFEIDGDVATAAQTRLRAYERWHRLSRDAATLAAANDDDATSAYAHLNAGSACTRLSALANHDVDEQRLLLARATEHLKQAEHVLAELDDYRGQGWSHLHRCDAIWSLISIYDGDSFGRTEYLLELERHANEALARLKVLEDTVALSMAYMQLGRALVTLHTPGQDSAIAGLRLERAVAAFQLSSELAEHTAFSPDPVIADLGLARCYFAQYEASGVDGARDLERLQLAIHAQTQGLTRLYVGQANETALASLRDYLDGLTLSVLRWTPG